MLKNEVKFKPPPSDTAAAGPERPRNRGDSAVVDPSGARHRTRRMPRPRSIAIAVSFLFAALSMYWEAFTFRSFGPEFAYFFELNHGITFGGVVGKYFQLGNGWYRPTEFYAPYWLLSKVISWHSITYWKIAAFATLLILCAALYRLVRFIFPGERLGAFLALIYFVTHPAHYLVLFEISAFDFGRQESDRRSTMPPAPRASCWRSRPKRSRFLPRFTWRRHVS
jgi:hypothetical protein